MRNLQRNSAFFLLLCLFGWLGTASAQVSVAIAPPLHPKFTDNSGNVLAGGFLYSYSAGTTTLLPTYADSGGIVQNTDPISLDSTGAPSNGSSQTGIWLGNLSYKFCAFNSSLVQQWCTDNVTGYFGLLNLPNTWTFAQTFTQPITDTQTDNQIVLGAVGNQTTLDFPPPAGNVTLHFPITTDTMVGRATTDTLTNKTLTSPVVTGGTFSAPGLNVLKNTTVVTQTGDTALHTIYTVAIPANLMGPNNQMRITLVMDTNVTAGGPVVQIKYGGTLISPNTAGVPVALSATLGGDNGVYAIILGGNLGVTNSQSWDDLAVAWMNPVSVGNLHHQTSAIDSTVPQNVTVTYTGGANADSITFRRILIEIL